MSDEEELSPVQRGLRGLAAELVDRARQHGFLSDAQVEQYALTRLAELPATRRHFGERVLKELIEDVVLHKLAGRPGFPAPPPRKLMDGTSLRQRLEVIVDEMLKEREP